MDGVGVKGQDTVQGDKCPSWDSEQGATTQGPY